MSETIDGIEVAPLVSYIERIENLNEERKGISDDIREVFAQARGQGYDVKVMREIIRLRKMDSIARAEREELLAVYETALENKANKASAEMKRKK